MEAKTDTLDKTLTSIKLENNKNLPASLKTNNFCTTQEAIEEIKSGRMIILIDDEDRENEGDLVIAAQFATPEAINFMAKHARGLICFPAEKQILDRLDLDLMVESEDPFRTAFTVSIDAKYGTTTGISAADRALTIQTAIKPDAKPEDFVKPGHVFPLIAKKGGVLVRAGHTEGSVDLAKMAGLIPAAVICEIMNEDGTMARTEQLIEVAKQHNIKIATIADIIEYRMRTEKLIKRQASAHLPTKYGDFEIIVYTNSIDNYEHVALVKGHISPDEPVLVRVHSSCLTGDILGSLRCDCGDQLHTAMKMVEKAGKGVILYMQQEGRGIGLSNKIKAYKLQDEGYDTVEANEKLGFKADLRNYGIGAQMLVDVGVRKMRLMTNNPKKIVALRGYGLEVVERVPIEIEPNDVNRCYLSVKKTKMGHILNNV
jgi:3,4-dihydroxy 2-butanone 4-phosphate synthase/GTP cyclohydrolase II